VSVEQFPQRRELLLGCRVQRKAEVDYASVRKSSPEYQLAEVWIIGNEDSLLPVSHDE
jgi:hypothetical protein